MSEKKYFADQASGFSSDQLKRLAKKIKKEKGISHSHALDEAAQLLGYQNYGHFINQAKK